MCFTIKDIKDKAMPMAKEHGVKKLAFSAPMQE